ncbi:MAG: hypothetical protein CME06_09320 [Gemmatimonadetes bacterium]|nr:hypothetical protein [Gemmatimonadota bacterium]
MRQLQLQINGDSSIRAAPDHWTLLEVLRYELHQGPSLLDYAIPSSVDILELRALIVESIDPEGPYGAKEAGEGPLHPAIPALSKAVRDAIGVRLTRLPFLRRPACCERCRSRERRLESDAALAGLRADRVFVDCPGAGSA